jgi:glycosyltransferase involved in cell wall biosynthesis
MNSEHTRQIINEIAQEEGLSDRAIKLIVSSQFEGVNKVITSGVPNELETFKSVRLNAFGIFLKENPDYDLIIVGEGEERDFLTSQIDELMISENVCLYGIRQRDEIAVLLNQSEFFVLSSVIEGFPKAILESMACGTPVISFDVGNVSSIIQDSGVIVKKREDKHLLLFKDIIIIYCL